jgi:hypothetical protein
MGIMSDFASLLQLGVGIGLGLSVFRAPLDLRTRAIEAGIEQEWLILDRLETPRAQSLRGEIATLKLNYNQAKTRIERMQYPLLILTILGAMANWLGLAYAAIRPSLVVSTVGEYAILALTIFYFVVILIALELIARFQLGQIQARLTTLRSG